MRRNEVLKAQAQERAEKLEAFVEPMREQGKTLREVADALNGAGIGTPRGGEWHPTSVQRLFRRLAA